MDERYCSNCRAELPEKADACPECGVFAGDLYDERIHRPKTRYGVFAALLVVALAAGGAAIWWNARTTLPERTVVTPAVKPRPPGPVANQAEAIRAVRQHLIATRGLKKECIVLLGNGFTGGVYLVTARDHCTSTRLGKWRVDGRTGEVGAAR